jgi:hypothetical protein
MTFVRNGSSEKRVDLADAPPAQAPPPSDDGSVYQSPACMCGALVFFGCTQPVPPVRLLKSDRVTLAGVRQDRETDRQAIPR